MSELVLNTAIGNYGHTAPLKDGSIISEKFKMNHIEVSPVTSIFRRMVRNIEFDVAEMALATYLCARAHGKPFIALPIFLTHDFYHSGIVYNIHSGIKTPKDLEGRNVGVRSYTLTPGVWTRAILQTEYDVDLEAVTWILSGDEHVAEFVAPPNVISSSNNNLAEMLLSGEIDAAIGAGPIASRDVQPLFPDAPSADAKWHKKTGFYPISHLLVVKDAVLESEPDLALDIFRIFNDAKAAYMPRLHAGVASGDQDLTLLKRAEIVGDDPIPYGYERSRNTIEAFISFNLEQNVIPNKVNSEDLFPTNTLSLV